MAEIDHPDRNIRDQMAEIFRSLNFCFATKEIGRSPTFYFAKGGLIALNTASLCGRIRTQHPKGPLIDITTAPKQHFFAPDKPARDEIYFACRPIRTIAGATELAAAHRTTPQAGDSHFEITMAPAPGSRREFSRLHPSGGSVCLAPRPTSDDQVIAVLNRVLAYEYVVKIDNVAQPSKPNLPPQMGTEKPVQGKGMSLAAYLESL